MLGFKTKSDTVLALQEGLFGNAPVQFQTVDEVTSHVGDVPVVVRSKTPGGRCWYDIKILDWLIEYQDAVWFDPKNYYFNLPIDPSTVTLNAEITRVAGEVYMTYATTKQHMRPALRYWSQHARGLKALTIMRSRCCDRGREVVEGLIDQYPEHVVEFTCMSKAYGTLGWNTVVWECRGY